MFISSSRANVCRMVSIRRAAPVLPERPSAIASGSERWGPEYSLPAAPPSGRQSHQVRRSWSVVYGNKTAVDGAYLLINAQCQRKANVRNRGYKIIISGGNLTKYWIISVMSRFFWYQTCPNCCVWVTGNRQIYTHRTPSTAQPSPCIDSKHVVYKTANIWIISMICKVCAWKHFSYYYVAHTITKNYNQICNKL